MQKKMDPFSDFVTFSFDRGLFMFMPTLCLLQVSHKMLITLSFWNWCKKKFYQMSLTWRVYHLNFYMKTMHILLLLKLFHISNLVSIALPRKCCSKLHLIYFTKLQFTIQFPQIRTQAKKNKKKDTSSCFLVSANL